MIPIDKKGHLLYHCNCCGHEEAARNNCIYSNSIVQVKADILSTVSLDVVHDPALSRVTTECPECHRKMAVFFMAHNVNEEGMSLIFVCCSCHRKWISGGGKAAN